MEIEELFFRDNYTINIIYLTETQHKYEKILINDALKTFKAIREKPDKKRGRNSSNLSQVKTGNVP